LCDDGILTGTWGWGGDGQKSPYDGKKKRLRDEKTARGEEKGVTDEKYRDYCDVMTGKIQIFILVIDFT
jgi:hypothetical protein